jgi:hypothetical protein
MTLSEQIDRYLLSLITLRSAQTIVWYRKRLDPLRKLKLDIYQITLYELQTIYQELSSRKTQTTAHLVAWGTKHPD